ncbi:uncharacterized protein LOC133299790 [Gastrolobium bilobum]|uniref:uncharacterized protein LOC133299790 n=1 Tax=Gastrolobium bilobum TaxID=150636 RepID=UPI002AB124B0|nr:uncharacterized protein LOC133299790 [Gastrolobium bilobum]
MGIKGDVKPCKKTPLEVRNALKEAYEKNLADKNASLNELQEDDDELEEVEEIHNLRTGKRGVIPSSDSSVAAKKGNTVKSPMDLLLLKNPENSFKLGERQTSINDACDKEARARTIQYIEKFLVTNGIPFNVVRSRSFRLMVEAIGNYGPRLKVSSYYECRVTLLQKELKYTKQLLKEHAIERVNYGYSIILDGWTDKKGRTLINFLVNYPSGTMFVKSVDASSYMKTGEKLHELLDTFVMEIDEQNVVQVVTDNRSNYVLADLMLEDIGKLDRVKRTIKRGISLVGFIYNHSLALNTMQKFTSKTELVRHGVTRFATTFLTLQRLYKQKSNLRRMFTSDEWSKSKTAKDPKGKRATDIVLNTSFWNDIVYCLKAMGPLVGVLRMLVN